jgi:hypothetical protein
MEIDEQYNRGQLVAESEDQVSSLREDIQQVYDVAFSSEEAFNQYFFATPDVTPHDAQVRIGVVLKRFLDEPSERFWLMRRTHRKQEMPETSIMKIEEFDGFGRRLYLNGYLFIEMEQWRKEQPNDIEKFFQQVEEIVRQKYKLPAPKAEDGEKVIYGYPAIDMPTEAIQEALQAVLPSDSSIEFEDDSPSGRHFEVMTPQLSLRFHCWQHDTFGDFFGINFSDNPVNIDRAISSEFEKYYQDEIVPTLLGNAIEYMAPKHVRHAIEGRMQKGQLVEQMFMKPNVFERGPKTKKPQYFAWGHSIDLSFDYAVKFKLLPAKMDNMGEGTFLHGWFLEESQLWEALFNSPYPGEVVIQESNTTEHGIKLHAAQISATHLRVLEHIDTEDGHRSDNFLRLAQDVVAGYRMYTTEDVARFTFPGRYQPIAVSLDGEFAIAFARKKDGLEICFQLSNEKIISQIQARQDEYKKEIRDLSERVDKLEVQKSKYAQT